MSLVFFIFWNLDKAIAVRLVEPSIAAGVADELKLLRFFLASRNFKKSEIFSSSVVTEAFCAASGRTPELGAMTEEDTLPRPLLLFSSSVRLAAPSEYLFLR